MKTRAMMMIRKRLVNLAKVAVASVTLVLSLGAGPALAQQVGTARYILELQGYTCSRFVGTDAWVCSKPGAPTYDCVGYVCQPVVATVAAPPAPQPVSEPPVATR
jgi:hypothetical protein